jgi:hypothetical protein
MSEVKETASLEDMINADATDYDTVEAHGKTFRIGALCSGDMIDWLEMQGDKERGKFAGLYLLVMSLAGPNGERIAREERDAVVGVFKGKEASGNRAIIKAARKLNKLDELGKVLDALKNVSGEANTDASPTDSPSSSAE